MNILSFYQHLLEDSHIVVDKEGILHRQYKGLDDNPKPLLLKHNKKDCLIVMPIKSQTDKAGWVDRVAFHPLTENVSRGESLVLEKYRKYMIARMGFTYNALMGMLYSVAKDTASHSKLTPQQSALVSTLNDVDEKFAELFPKLVVAAMEQNTPIINIYLKRSGAIDGKIFQRAAVVSSPWAEKLYAIEDKEFLGHKVRVKDINILKALLQVVFPYARQDDFSAYSAGSNAMRAPSLQALLFSISKMASDINTIAESFKKSFKEVWDETHFELQWLDFITDLDAQANELSRIPMMPGNEGKSLVKQKEETTPPWEPATTAPVVQAPVQEKVSAPVQAASQQVQQPAYTGGPVGNQYPNYQAQPVNNYHVPHAEKGTSPDSPLARAMNAPAQMPQQPYPPQPPIHPQGYGFYQPPMYQGPAPYPQQGYGYNQPQYNTGGWEIQQQSYGGGYGYNNPGYNQGRRF